MRNELLVQINEGLWGEKNETEMATFKERIVKQHKIMRTLRDPDNKFNSAELYTDL